ncbi:Acetyl-CoA carboxylase biotin carboxylase subunit [Trichostrongylus colubriformis]|uniref:Acetyl-CoA carboxylase biotin carboxylase subunit n=1 Tax=Trichostrongylus colubriformis TaxID=6319 RepID=A0AAN8FNR3_TRICO
MLNPVNALGGQHSGFKMFAAHMLVIAAATALSSNDIHAASDKILCSMMLFRHGQHRCFLKTFVRRENSHAALERKSFKKVLVANRGEVAARIFRTLREMEIESVGIYTYEDRYTQHRLRADKSFRIGNGKDPVAPYTDIERIIEVAVKNNVDAIHPGHDFLAKRPEFAERVLSEGISYIGPTPSVIEQMRDNFKARLCAIETNLQVIPGSSIPLTSPEEAVKIVKEFGTPILLKPAHGSGGQAMQYVHNPRQIAEAFELMSNKARKLFGDGSLIIEKFIDQPRHIEIQVLADQQGDVVHLFERDCSLQLKQQKFLEMAPARRLDEEIRSRLYADAIALARHIGYRNAGAYAQLFI